MARLRTIKPGFFTDDELGECDPLVRLLYAGLWVIADREGRLEDRPKRIKAEVQPYDNSDVDALLDELARRGFIVRYRVGSTKYIAIPSWKRHQNPHIKEAESTIPAPPLPGENSTSLPYIAVEHQTSTVQAPGKHSSIPAGLVLGLGSCLGSGNQAPTEPVAPDAADEVPVAPLAAPLVPAVVVQSEHQALWDAFTDVFGQARGKTEGQRRGEACKRAGEARASPDEIRLAAEHWPNVMGNATMTELGLMSNLGKLLHGPQVNGRSNGITRSLQQNLRQTATVPPDDMAAIRALRARKAH